MITKITKRAAKWANFIASKYLEISKVEKKKKMKYFTFSDQPENNEDKHLRSNVMAGQMQGEGGGTGKLIIS